MSDQNPDNFRPIDDEDALNQVQLYGTHLYAISTAYNLAHLDSFPPGQARWICSEASDGLNTEARQREAQRALKRFGSHIAADSLDQDEQYIVAVGVGHTFRITDLDTFRDQFAEEEG
jgi:hypothetical protein